MGAVVSKAKAASVIFSNLETISKMGANSSAFDETGIVTQIPAHLDILKL